MNRVTWVVVIVLILGLAWWLGSPLFIDKRVSEEFPTVATTSSSEVSLKAVLKGNFTGFDRIHAGSGDVNVIETNSGRYVVRFEENFNVANGPDLFVGLGKDGKYKEETQLAPLKGNIGSQNYEIPSHININDYNEVWIWCRAFSVPFAKAVLEPI